MIIPPITFKNDKLYLLDQRILPNEEKIVELDSLESVFNAIRDMVVRGAPCIGFTAIYGMALWIKHEPTLTKDALIKAKDFLISSRPTAVNLKYEVERTVNMILDNLTAPKTEIYKKIVAFGDGEILNSENLNTKMAEFVIADLVKKYPNKKLRMMTHCNTGYLACGSIGTALGVITKLKDKNLLEHVYADETRPYMQGARLTAYELSKNNISHEIVVEGAASFLMKNKLVDAIVVGADRIVENGDTANKVGTSTLAIVAHFYKIPFYVIAPISSFDLSTKTGNEIEIEMRDPLEILEYKNHRVAPKNSKALNPSFDVTDSSLIEGISCEKGLIKTPYVKNIRALLC